MADRGRVDLPRERVARWRPAPGRMAGRSIAFQGLLAMSLLCASLGLAPVGAEEPAYRIKPGDVLLFTVNLGPTAPQFGLSWKGKVEADGSLHLGPYGSVPVAGLT